MLLSIVIVYRASSSKYGMDSKSGAFSLLLEPSAKQYTNVG